MKDLITFHGASGALADKLVAAHEAGLQVREITHGINGYPEPFHGEFFVSGFNDFVAAEAFARASGGVVGEARWKDGWAAVERFSPRNCPLEPTCMGVGDNDRVFTVAHEIEYVKSAIGGEDDGERLAEWAQWLKELAVKNRKAVVLTSGTGGAAEAWARDEAMRLHYDVQNWEIGVMLDEEDDDEEVDG